jgi:hypothetical protein
MTKSGNADRNDRSALIDDAQLDAVVGGASPQLAFASPQLRLASLVVGGWSMPDVWTRPTLGTYH